MKRPPRARKGVGVWIGHRAYATMLTLPESVGGT